MRNGHLYTGRKGESVFSPQECQVLYVLLSARDRKKCILLIRTGCAVTSFTQDGEGECDSPCRMSITVAFVAVKEKGNNALRQARDER